MRRLTTTILLILTAAIYSSAQNDLIVGQYIHNQYAINPAFAGSREGLSIFGSWRKQWASIENTPTSLLLTAHAPLKKEKLTVGLQVWSQTIHQSRNSGAEVSIGYRTKVSQNSWLSLALLPGVSMRSTDWTTVKTIDEGDDIFSEKTTSTSPLLGFGIGHYSKRHFVGLSVTSLFLCDDFEMSDSEFAPGKAQYVATGGYMFDAGKVKVQPSVMASYSKANEFDATGTVTAIWNDFIWIDAAYSTRNELNFGAAIQALPQLRIAYNYGLTTGDLSKYSNGTHEISIQYDLVYKIKTVGPRFF